MDLGMVLARDKTRLLVVREVEVLAIAQEPTLLEDRETQDKVLPEEMAYQRRFIAVVVVVVPEVLEKLDWPIGLEMEESE